MVLYGVVARQRTTKPYEGLRLCFVCMCVVANVVIIILIAYLYFYFNIIQYVDWRSIYTYHQYGCAR